MFRHMYDWNIVNCDVKQPIQLNSFLSSPIDGFKAISTWVSSLHTSHHFDKSSAMSEISLIVTLNNQFTLPQPPPPREDAGGLSREYILRIPSVS